MHHSEVIGNEQWKLCEIITDLSAFKKPFQQSTHDVHWSKS